MGNNLSIERLEERPPEYIRSYLYAEVKRFRGDIVINESDLHRIKNLTQLLDIKETGTLLPNKLGYHSYLSIIAGYKSLDLIQHFIDIGEDVNIKVTNSLTPIWRAISHTNIEALKILLKAGANIHDTLTTGSSQRLSYLHKIISSMDSDGFIVDDEGWRHVTRPDINVNTEDFVILLIEQGIDIEARDIFGNTALDLAATYGHRNMIKLLLAAGAKIDCFQKLQHIYGEGFIHHHTMGYYKPLEIQSIL